jgi:hypothetical protein
MTLASRPDNVPLADRRTFHEAFKDVVVNFTHWEKWTDDSAPPVDVASGCFIRCIAAICRNSRASVDAFIPVLLDGFGSVTVDNLTGILVQFKLRMEASLKAKVGFAHEDVYLYPTGDSKKRPCIKLVLDIGVVLPSSILAVTPTNANYKVAEQVREAKLEAGQEKLDQQSYNTAVTSSTNPEAPSRIEILSSGESDHLRFIVSVCECSPRVYKVIKESERGMHWWILRSSEMLAEYAHQDEESL